MAEASEIRPTSPGAKLGSTGVNVERVQNHLSQFGYFDTGRHAQFGMTTEGSEPPPDQLGQFDAQTEAALRKYQAFMGLEQTGEVDDATVAKMGEPRCQFVDVGSPRTPEANLASFVAQGNSWSNLNLQYGFVNYTNDLTVAETEAAVDSAFDLWAAVTPLTFTKTAASSNPEIRISFVSGDHGDGSPFDGAGGVLAHAFYPPPNGGDIAGDAHFDEAETWTVSGSGGFDLETVAAHEFGHSLGLAHSSVANALMFPTYSGVHRFLDADDIAGIQSIYGSLSWVTATVVRTFATYHSRNGWAFLDGDGWRKARPVTNDGVTNMFEMLCSARTSNSTVTAEIVNGEIETLYF